MTSNDFGTDFYWESVSGTHEQRAHTAALVHGKVLSATWWPFLSHATSDEDFENRLSLVSNKIESSVDPEIYPEVIESLRSDFRAVHEAAQHTSPELNSESGIQSTRRASIDQEYFNVEKNKWERVAAAPPPVHTTYTPDPNKGWRYHYPDLNGPVDNGALQGPDGFPVNLAEDEARSTPIMVERQLTPGVWTQHDGMPERPMPFSQQRGYMPVNASTHYDDVTGDPYGEDDDTYNSKTKCPTCKGTGWAPGQDPNKGESYGKISDYCPSCYGSGLDQRHSSLSTVANKYIKQQGDQWVILQKGTGKVLSHHDSQEEAEASFRAMEMHKHEGAAKTQYGVTYRHNNSGGHDWLDPEHWKALEDNGWQLSHLFNSDDHPFKAEKNFSRKGEGKREWKQLTGQNPNVRGCDCCGPPHNFDETPINTGDKHLGSRLAFDADGFLVQAAAGRGVDPLQDPPPGASQKVNPFYFNPGSAMGANEGFPVAPTPDPIDRVNEIYGEQAPAASVQDTSPSVDGEGYSRAVPGESGNVSSPSETYPNPGPAKTSGRSPNFTAGRHSAPDQLVGLPHNNYPSAHEVESVLMANGYPVTYLHDVDHGIAHGLLGLEPTNRHDQRYMESYRRGASAANRVASLDESGRYVVDSPRDHTSQGFYDAQHSRPYAGEENQDTEHARAYRQGWDAFHNRRQDAHTASTDGKIVGHCPGCQKPLREHTTPHGTELHHLHNDSVRCFGSKKRANGPGSEVGSDVEEGKQLALDPASPDSNDQAIRPQMMGSRLPQFFDPTDSIVQTAVGQLSNGNLQVEADYLGRPDANNPTGRGEDEYRAERWDAFQHTRPFQSPEDRHINTPVLPDKPIPTRNINTPTPGLREGQDDDRDDDEDEGNEDDD